MRALHIIIMASLPSTEDDSNVAEHDPSIKTDEPEPHGTIQYSRQDSNHSLTASSRLQAYSDAIFSIIATVMILPIAHHEIKSHESLYETLGELSPLLVVYFMSFFVVSAAWAGHVWVFQTIANADDAIVLLNLGILMVVTFLPFSFTLLGNFVFFRLPIGIYSLCIIIIGLLQTFTVVYAFKEGERILTQEIYTDPSKNKKRAALIQVLLTNPMICLVATVVGAIDGAAGQALLLLLLFGQPVRKTVFWFYNKCKFRIGRTSLPDAEFIPDKFTNEVLSMERVEAFSDGVFAIVATLIILDICEDNVPTQQELKDHDGDLVVALQKDWAVYLAYLGTFITVGMLWFVHHSVCHFLLECNKLMSSFNTWSLACIGVAPLGFKLTSQFALSDYAHNERIAIQFNCVILFLASIFQMMMFVTALCKPQHRIHPSASYNGREHGYLTAKLSVYPCISLLIYFISFHSDILSTDMFNFMQLGIPIFFILLKVIFNCLKHKR
ncbi:endosomal/lysosomal proton channel TMEM175-like isoform X2 [Ptychodera flava]|uniref:endosomal/lysosomal proton channel TMEM175-like isoform X2 n=1 Tax=Ptychodera flava TaxID=63121 RepID=UPI00396AA64F